MSLASMVKLPEWRRCRRGLRDQGGGTLLEMAVVLPPFFLLLFGLFEFSIVLLGYCSAAFACREAARYASVRSSTSISPCTTASIQALAKTQIWAPAATITVNPTWPSGNTIGNTVKISVSVAYPVGLAVLSLSTVTVTAATQRTIMR
jgi:Flp pilus assembly protein TadG